MRLSFFKVDSNYCEYLRQFDPNVPYIEAQKATRPFVGILIRVNACDYYAPLTSPKPKHLNMKNQLDFLKINEGLWGAVNFNNMIPIHTSSLFKIDLKIMETDTKDEISYKNLLTNQLSWCNSNKDRIFKQAEKLYRLISQKRARTELINRCCNFTLDEEKLQSYIKLHNFNK